MLNEWYKSGQAALYDLSERKKKDSLELQRQRKDSVIKNSLKLVTHDISKILENI